jgi:predicted ATPase
MATGTNALSGVGRRQTWRHGGGISLLRSGSAAHRAAGAETVMPYFLGLLARACEIAGQLKEAVTHSTMPCRALTGPGRAGSQRN